MPSGRRPCGDGLDAHGRHHQVGPQRDLFRGVGEQERRRRGPPCPCGGCRCPARRPRRRPRRRQSTRTDATSSTVALSRSRTTGSTPSATRSGSWSLFRMTPTTESPRAVSSRPRRRATRPWAPAMTMRMTEFYPSGPAASCRARARSAGVSQSSHGGGLPGDGAGCSRAGRSGARTRRSDGRAHGGGHRRPQRRRPPGAQEQLVPAGVVDDEGAVAGEAPRAAPRSATRSGTAGRRRAGRRRPSAPRPGRPGARRPVRRRAAARAPGRRRPGPAAEDRPRPAGRRPRRRRGPPTSIVRPPTSSCGLACPPSRAAFPPASTTAV